MRTTKVLLAAAVTAVGIGTSLAQVTSVNTVGFINLTLGPGYTIIANQLNASNNNNNLNIILPGAPDDCRIFKWKAGTQSFAASDTSIGGLWYDDDFNLSTNVLDPGQAAFFYNPGAQITMTLVGEVPQSTVANPNLTVTLPANYGLISSIVPQSVGLDTIGLPTVDDMRYFTWRTDVTPGRYSASLTAIGGAWYDDDFNVQHPTPAVGQGFFIWNPGPSVAWTRQFNVQ